MRIFIIAALILFSFSCKKTSTNPGGNSYNFPDGLPAQLQKGINLSNWFNDYSDPAQFATRFTAAHFATLKSLGFTYIRLPIGNTILFQPANPSQLNTKNIGYIDNAVKMITDAGLAVILDHHPWQDDYEKQLYYNPSKITELQSYWTALATHFTTYTPQQVFFEVYNEPHYAQIAGDADGWKWWWPLQEKLVQSIRAAAGKYYIIAGGEGWNSIQYLTSCTPYDTKGVVYNFHFYEPFVFTHQGATWVGDPWPLLHDVPYPSTPENVAPLIAATTNTDVQNLLSWYGNYRYNADTLDKLIKVAADWATAHNVPLMCNEFGVYKTYAPPADRAACIHDVRSILEKYKIGWAMWECDEGFGLLTYPGSDRNNFTTDTGIAHALGLE